MTAAVVQGDARCLPLPDASVDLIVTSPPYFGLRSYTDTVKCYECIQMEYNGRDPRQAWPDYAAHVREVHQRHYEGQIGSEATPGEWLAALVDCTREWVRVLKPSGSIFVNLGDSFSSGQRYDNEFTIEDGAWLGGVIDSDGSISVHKQGTSYTAWMRVGQMRPEVVHRIRDVTGVGQVFQDKRGVWNWNAAAQQASAVLVRIWPWLHIKRRQAFAAVELQARKAAIGGKGRWNALTGNELRHRERIRQAVLTWNAGEADDYEPPLLPLPDLPMRAHWIPAKSLMGLPWRYALAAQDELGLILRRDIIFSKVNGLPESVTDRCRSSHEYVFHLVRQPRYYAAVDEIREPTGTYNGKSWLDRKLLGEGPRQGEQRTPTATVLAPNPLGKLPGSVWDIPSQPLTVPPELGIDHFAAFPMELPRRIILGWSPPGVCTACGEGRRPVQGVDWAKVPHRMVDKRALTETERLRFAELFCDWQAQRGLSGREIAELFPSRTGGMTGCVANWRAGANILMPEQADVIEARFGPLPAELIALVNLTRLMPVAEFQVNVGPPGSGRHRNREPAIRPDGYHAITGYACACPTPDAPTRPAVVLDPFGGTGTTALVADMLGRHGITIDRSADYSRLARWRIRDPAERARALGVAKPPPVPAGQVSLFDLDGEAS